MSTPNLVSVVVNGGASPTIQINNVGGVPPSNVVVNVAGQQSVVHNLRLEFDIPVNLAADAVSIAPKAGVVVRGPVAPNQLAVTTEVDALPGAGGKVWVVTFDGPGTEDSGAIRPGVYDVTLDPAKVVSGATPMAAAPPPFTFWAMYAGAVVGTGVVVRAEAISDVNSLDGKFGLKATDGGYLARYDANLDGLIDGIDLTKAQNGNGTIWVF